MTLAPPQGKFLVMADLCPISLLRMKTTRKSLTKNSSITLSSELISPQSKKIGRKPKLTDGSVVRLPQKPRICITGNAVSFFGLRLVCSTGKADGGNRWGNLSKAGGNGAAGILALKRPAIDAIVAGGGNFQGLPGAAAGKSWTGGGADYAGHAPLGSVPAAISYLQKYFKVCACPNAVDSLRAHGVDMQNFPICDSHSTTRKSLTKNSSITLSSELISPQSKKIGRKPKLTDGSVVRLPQKPRICITGNAVSFFGLRLVCSTGKADGGNRWGNLSKAGGNGAAGILALKRPAIDAIVAGGGNFQGLPGAAAGKSWTGGGADYASHAPLGSVPTAINYLQKYFIVCACPNAVESLGDHGVDMAHIPACKSTD